jgi:hypothetical protein
MKNILDIIAIPATLMPKIIRTSITGIRGNTNKLRKIEKVLYRPK